jgi:hypothetical protein
MGIVIGLGVLLVAFQNCGKAGFDSGEMDLASLFDEPKKFSADSRFSKLPFPFELTLNQVAYGSCPLAGDGAKAGYANLVRPYFSIRAGAFDNRQFGGPFGIGLPNEVERTQRLNAGLGLSKSFVMSVQNSFRRKDNEIIQKSLQSHPLAQDLRPTLALVNMDRSLVEGGFGWDSTLIHPSFASLSANIMSAKLAESGTERISFVPEMNISDRALMGSFAWGKNETDRQTFNSQLRTNLMLVAGFSKNSTDIFQLLSPTSNITQTLYGRGYRMSFGAISAQGLTSLHTHFLRGVTEMDIETSPAQDSTDQSWDCFSLRIVRPSDRINHANGLPFCAQHRAIGVGEICPDNNPTPGDPRTVLNTTYAFTTPNLSVIRGVRAACPTQTLPSLNERANYNGITANWNLIRLQIARRFLPADLFELNTDPHFLCAVPLEKALTSGKCYSSGDTSTDKYIQYSVNQDMGNGTFRPCGSAGGNECPAYISICYRFR